MDEYIFKANTQMSKETVEKYIDTCKNEEHFQQVAYSVHGNALTQTCFDCFKIRTSLKLVKIFHKELSI